MEIRCTGKSHVVSLEVWWLEDERIWAPGESDTENWAVPHRDRYAFVVFLEIQSLARLCHKRYIPYALFSKDTLSKRPLAETGSPFVTAKAMRIFVKCIG